MRQDAVEIEGTAVPLYSLNTLIVGSGAAALNAAVQLFDRGQRDLAIATERWGGGTSCHAGSDKQTYYKLSLSTSLPDSPRSLAEDLCRGGGMQGDIALCEAQHSLQAFFHLVAIGVPFPHDRYGSYVGYKTDHDPLGRATSAGPLTSRLMFECLGREVKKRGIPVFDGFQVVGLLTASKEGEKQVIGALALDRNGLYSPSQGFVLFNAVNVVLATGGPAGMYQDSVYPESQTGSHGLAFEAGAVASNLTESQFGLASVKFRWNISGTYQQAIPRYISTGPQGDDEREFLTDFFPDMGRLATAIFLKGYEWPFDSRKVAGYGSSLIDLLVFRERVVKRRKVFLDYTRNPGGGGKLEDFSFKLLGKEAYDYLARSGALLGTPAERLRKMNQPAVDLFLNKGIDLAREYLEVAVCAQHNNGGFQGNIWWESNLKHLFPVGEANGSHGVYRPGGSALNAGQVGSLRAAMYIARRYGGEPPAGEKFLGLARAQVKRKLEFARNCLVPSLKDEDFLEPGMKEIQERMSRCGALVRDPPKVGQAAEDAWSLYARMKSRLKISSAGMLPSAFKTLDLCLTHALYLEAVKEYLERDGKSRGSYLVPDREGKIPCQGLGEEWRFGLTPEDAFVSRKILEVFLDQNFKVKKRWVQIRPIPGEDQWFQKVWNEYLNDKIIR